LPCSDSNHDNHKLRHPFRGSRACVLLRIDVQPIRHRRTGAQGCPHWLLALTIPFSRSDRAHTCRSRCWCRVSPRKLRTASSHPRDSFGCRRAGGRPFRRVSYLTRRANDSSTRGARAPLPPVGRPRHGDRR